MNYNALMDQIGNFLLKDGKKNWPAITVVYLVILFPIVFLAGYSSLQARRDLIRSVRSQRLHLAHSTAAVLQEKLNRLTDLGTSLASRVRFRQLVSAGKWADASEILRAVPRDFPWIDSYFLADPKGNLMAGFPLVDEARARNLAGRDWYQGGHENRQPYISDVYQSAAAQRRKVIAAVAPIKADDGQPAGVLVLEVTLDSLHEWIKDIDAGEQAAILVFDKKGKLAAHPTLDLQREIHDLSASAAVQKARAGSSGSRARRGA